MNYQSITEQVIALAKEVAEYIKTERENFSFDKVETKSKNDFVSYVDQESEKQLVKVLRTLIPEAGFITEEGTTAKANNEDYLWIIDPLDGTTNFIHNSTPYAISIALSYKGKIVVGVIHEITRGETFYSWENAKSFLDGKAIQVSTVPLLKESLIVFGRPHHYMDRYAELLASVDYFMKNTHGLRLSGSAAVDLAYVACGRYDGRFEFNLKPWDIAAGCLLVQNAGGCVGDFHGGSSHFENGMVLASNALIFDKLQSKVGEFYK